MSFTFQIVLSPNSSERFISTVQKSMCRIDLNPAYKLNKEQDAKFRACFHGVLPSEVVAPDYLLNPRYFSGSRSSLDCVLRSNLVAVWTRRLCIRRRYLLGSFFPHRIIIDTHCFEPFPTCFLCHCIHSLLWRQYDFVPSSKLQPGLPRFKDNITVLIKPLASKM